MTRRLARPCALLLCFLLTAQLSVQKTVGESDSDQDLTAIHLDGEEDQPELASPNDTSITTTTSPKSTTQAFSTELYDNTTQTSHAPNTSTSTVSTPTISTTTTTKSTPTISTTTTTNSTLTTLTTTPTNSTPTISTTTPTNSTPTTVATATSSSTPTISTTTTTKSTPTTATTTSMISTEATVTDHTTTLFVTSLPTAVPTNGTSSATTTVLTIFAIIIFAALAIVLSCLCVRRIQKPTAFHILSDPDLNHYESGIATMDAMPVDETQFTGEARLTINDDELAAHRENALLGNADDELLITFDS